MLMIMAESKIWIKCTFSTRSSEEALGPQARFPTVVRIQPQETTWSVRTLPTARTDVGFGGDSRGIETVPGAACTMAYLSNGPSEAPDVRSECGLDIADPTGIEDDYESSRPPQSPLSHPSDGTLSGAGPGVGKGAPGARPRRKRYSRRNTASVRFTVSFESALEASAHAT